jgi:hypothetical protein
VGAAKRPDLKDMIRRSGDAAGLRPEEVVGLRMVQPERPAAPREPASEAPLTTPHDIPPPVESAEDGGGAGQGATLPAPVPAQKRDVDAPAEAHRPVIAMEAEPANPQLVSFTARIDPELRAAVRQFAEFQRFDVQKLVGILLEAGLIVQFGKDWRDQLDQKAPLWRSLKL